ncbi:MAG TPA: tyrosine-type recombinase/integrase [Actinophytocola sp.]|uniref:tyrosine-type recombinase/integrase n=1 Tax=Actinophytocola sp. TaxID=1872138 RepID=UPI002DF76544|nr:tyrosine-type recombinase/integrase [Actinophytocola sp.]
MSTLRTAMVDYLALRRSLGYKLERAGRLLAEFVTFAETRGADHVTVELALCWAISTSNPRSNWRAQRLGVLRGFARYLQAHNPNTEVPPRALIPRGPGRPTPFLYSPADITALMAAAGQRYSPLRAATLETLIGLLAVTGLRVAEAIRLDRGDVDVASGLLTVRTSKFGKSRLVPLHPSTVTALKDYARLRDRFYPHPHTPGFFISTTGTRLRAGNLRAVFAELRGHAAVGPRSGRRPRLGDLRHSMAMTTLLRWYADGENVQALLPLLSAYLGHVNPRSTYWYLSAAPELLAAASGRVETARGELA